MTLPLTEARAQVFKLCADNHISIIFSKARQDFTALLDARAILIKPIKSTITYVLCLHEVGHILNPRALNAVNELAAEAQAWKWAQANALYWNTTAEAQKNQCLHSYLNVNGEPAKSHVFWRVYQKYTERPYKAV